MKKTYQHASDILIDIAKNNDLNNKDISFQCLLQLLGKRAFGVAILLFALPSTLPLSIIPGISFVFSLPIMLLALQIIGARNTLWLPKIIAQQTIEHTKLVKIIDKTIPYLIKVERFLTPRWPMMTSRAMDIINGIVIFCLALLLIFPIPLSNSIFALLIVIFSLGLVEKDGLFILGGYIGALCYATFIYLFISSTLKILF